MSVDGLSIGLGMAVALLRLQGMGHVWVVDEGARDRGRSER